MIFRLYLFTLIKCLLLKVKLTLNTTCNTTEYTYLFMMHACIMRVDNFGLLFTIQLQIILFERIQAFYFNLVSLDYCIEIFFVGGFITWIINLHMTRLCFYSLIHIFYEY